MIFQKNSWISWIKFSFSLGLWPWLQKTFPQFPFVYFGNLGTTIIRGKKIFFRRVIKKIPLLIDTLIYNLSPALSLGGEGKQLFFFSHLILLTYLNFQHFPSRILSHDLFSNTFIRNAISFDHALKIDSHFIPLL